MRKYLTFTVFASGMITLAAEMSASRLIGNVFGTSNLVWAAIIGLILIYLAVGYSIGGRWADRSPLPQTMFRIIAWGAFTLGVIPFVARPVLWAAATAFDGLKVGILAGSFTAVLVLFSLPVTLLGMVSPFAIRICVEDTKTAGNVAGNLYAVSTLGSFIGTFLPSLILIPLIGTTRSFLTFSLILLAVALGGLWLAGERRSALIHLWMPLVLIILGILFSGLAVKKNASQVYEAESAYNYIQVLQDGDYRLLRLNEGQGIHSVYHPTQLYYGGPWEEFLAAPYFNPAPHDPSSVNRIAIVGLAAGTVARQATAVYGAVPIDGYEIDPEIVAVGRKYFDMNMPNLNVHVQDGRWGLSTSPYQYDIIAVDAYRPPYIPAHLTTQEFFQIAYDHLTDDGVLAINVGRAPGDRRLIDGMATTIASVFPSVYVIDVPDSFNSLIYATRQPTPDGAKNLLDNFNLLRQRTDIDVVLLLAVQTAVTTLQPGYQTTTVYTDDHAPIEWITNDMVLRYVLGGEGGGVQ
jgi:spermidine synthase